MIPIIRAFVTGKRLRILGSVSILLRSQFGIKTAVINQRGQDVLTNFYQINIWPCVTQEMSFSITPNFAFSVLTPHVILPIFHKLNMRIKFKSTMKCKMFKERCET